MGKKGSSSSRDVYPIFLAMNSSSLNVLDMKANVMKIMAQQDLSNNLNIFTIRDPSGGNCVGGFKIDNDIINYIISNMNVFICILKPSLVQIYQG